MKVVILAGGYGTRISEETDVKPKPMVLVGGKPILWHIMKTYSYYGFNEFVILLGYKGYYIKEYFSNYFLHQSDITIDLQENTMQVHNNTSEPWKVTLLETGLDTMTGGRILRARHYLEDKPFLLTYGDGVADVDIPKSIEQHNKNKKIVTLTAIQPEARFGNIEFDDKLTVNSFVEKPPTEAGWVNGGFFVCEPDVFNYIDGDDCFFEKEPLQKLAKKGELGVFKHKGFWQCMDTLRDNQKLNKLWNDGNAKWKLWND